VARVALRHYSNFAQENPDAVEHLNRLFKLEDEMIASGRLSHDFGVLVAAKPG
jgi:hypothetical protein